MKKYNHKKAEKKRTDSGITLIEILVSIVLLGIIAAFVALAIPTSVSLTGRTNKMETTAVLAQKYIEDVKSAFGSDPTLFNDIEEGTTPPITIDEKKHTNDGQYQITTSLSINNYAEIESVQEPCLATLTVTVTPKNGNTVETNSDQKVSVSTILRRDR